MSFEGTDGVLATTDLLNGGRREGGRGEGQGQQPRPFNNNPYGQAGGYGGASRPGY